MLSKKIKKCWHSKNGNLCFSDISDISGFAGFLPYCICRQVISTLLLAHCWISPKNYLFFFLFPSYPIIRIFRQVMSTFVGVPMLGLSWLLVNQDLLVHPSFAFKQDQPISNQSFLKRGQSGIEPSSIFSSKMQVSETCSKNFPGWRKCDRGLLSISPAPSSQSDPQSFSFVWQPTSWTTFRHLNEHWLNNEHEHFDKRKR